MKKPHPGAIRFRPDWIIDEGPGRLGRIRPETGSDRKVLRSHPKSTEATEVTASAASSQSAAGLLISLATCSAGFAICGWGIGMGAAGK
jgi:hypothetical protein